MIEVFIGGDADRFDDEALDALIGQRFRIHPGPNHEGRGARVTIAAAKRRADHGLELDLNPMLGHSGLARELLLVDEDASLTERDGDRVRVDIGYLVDRSAHAGSIRHIHAFRIMAMYPWLKPATGAHPADATMHCAHGRPDNVRCSICSPT